MGEALGDVSLDNGYAEALIIFGNRTIQGVGGGVSRAGMRDGDDRIGLIVAKLDG